MPKHKFNVVLTLIILITMGALISSGRYPSLHAEISLTQLSLLFIHTE